MTDLTRRALSLPAALGATTVGLLLALTGGVRVANQHARYDPIPSLGDIALLVVGLLLIVAAGASIALSRLGVVVTGGLLLLIGLVVMFAPLSPAGASTLMRAIFALARDPLGPGNGLLMTASMGMVTTLGALFVTLGFMTPSRRSAPGRSTLPCAAAGLLTVVCVWLVCHTGNAFYRVRLVTMGGEGLSGLIVLAAVVALCASLIPHRWSAAGGFVAGAIVALCGFLLIAAPAAQLGPLSARIFQSIGMTGSLGIPLVIAAALIGCSLGSVLGSRRAPQHFG